MCVEECAVCYLVFKIRYLIAKVFQRTCQLRSSAHIGMQSRYVMACVRNLSIEVIDITGNSVGSWWDLVINVDQSCVSSR